MTLPFLIRGPTQSRVRIVRVEGTSYNSILNRVLEKYPGKFVNIYHARRMVLMEAKAAAKKESVHHKGKPLFVYSDNTGECDYSLTERVGKGITTHAVFFNGKEAKLESFAQEFTKSNTKNKQTSADENATIMKTAVKNKSAKKSAKKVAHKAVAKPSGGKSATMTVKAIKDAVRKGAKAFNESMKPLPLGYLEKMTDVTREIKCTIVPAAKA